MKEVDILREIALKWENERLQKSSKDLHKTIFLAKIHRNLSNIHIKL